MTTDLSKISFIVNAGSGGVRLAEAREAIHAACRGKCEFHIYPVEEGTTLEQALASAMQSQPDILAACGGDGTVSAVAAAALKHDRVLGVLPLGTLNHFAKDIGLPLELNDALHALLTGQVANVDVATVNERVFINNSSLGLYPQIVRDREALQRRGLGKWTAFAKAAFSVVKRHPFLTMRLDVDGRALVRRTALLFVGNNQYKISGLEAGERDSIDQGILWMFLTRKGSRVGLAGLVLRSLLGTVERGRDLDSVSARKITIDTHKKLIDVAMDGEVFKMEPPLHYEIKPKVLKVIVPPGKNE